MEITWYGRACFRLKGKDATVITDPCPPSTGFVAGKHDVDLLTISHPHPDHSYTRSITAGLTLTRPGEYEFSDLLVTGIRTFHDGQAGGSQGENMVFAVEIDGVHVCHLGDLGHLLTDEQLTELGPVDVLLVPVGGETTLTPAEAAEVVAQVGPKIVIPMHFAVDGASKDLGGPEKFLHEMAAEPMRQPKAQVTVHSLPDETQVVVLEARGRTS
ncbi:MAG: MBL fold metallo-hydrolase [Chloroflexota bacterium]|nr:MBL fold metallo-hydrolase [Chloroflexota bacterium]